MLVIDASVAFVACANENGLRRVHRERLAAPALMWSETRSTIRERLWRGEIGDSDAQAMHHRLEKCAVEACSPAGLGVRAWGVAAEMGWAKTYDAEYIALAQILNCQLLTVDMRLRRGTQRLGCVITPDDLVAPDPSAAELREEIGANSLTDEEWKDFLARRKSEMLPPDEEG